MARFLVVDDSLLSRSSICNLLKKDGHITAEACNGFEAVEKVAAQAPDGILLDILMPEMNGLEVLQSLGKKESNIPVIVITADIQESTRKKCLELGAQAIINKPVKEQELQEAINKLLDL